MRSEVTDFLKGYFDEELVDYREQMRVSHSRLRPEVRERLRAGLADLIASRSLSTDDFWHVTWVRFADEDEMYRLFQEAYDFIFGDPADADAK
jgi:hypothetical protein